MSFLRKLFGKRNNDSKSSIGSFNNFPEQGFPEIQFTLMGNQAMDLMTSVGEIDKELKKKNISFEAKGFYYTKLCENGILNIPLIFKSEDKGYSLFFIYDQEQAQLFNYAKDIIGNSEYPNALYISTIDCKKITQKSSKLNSFSLSDLSFVEKPELKGEFGMWWSEENDPTFYQSQTKEFLEEIYKCGKEYESYIFGYILSEIKMKGFEEFKRVALPTEEQNIVVKGPEFLDIVISASQEKGIRFQFPKEKASSEYRSLLLRKIKSSLQAFQLLLEMKKAPKDEERDPNGYDWFNFMSNDIEKKEKEGEIKEQLSIGLISFK